MNFNHPLHKEMLLAMLDAGIDFLLIGGYAVNYHGYNRSTGDMDLWVKPTDDSKQGLLKVFREMGFEDSGLDYINSLDFTEVVVFHLCDKPERIDFLSKIQGLNFADAYARRESITVQGKEVPVLHLDDLIVSKLLADRPQDRADVEMLQDIKRNKRP